MKLDNLNTIEQMESFIKGSQAIAFAVASSKDERYQLVEQLLRRFAYSRLKRREKGIVIQFLIKVSGYSRQQLTRMIKSYSQQGRLKRHQKTVNGFERIYTTEDVKTLAELDKRHDTPNGMMGKNSVNGHIIDSMTKPMNVWPTSLCRIFITCASHQAIKNIVAIMIKRKAVANLYRTTA